MNSSQALRSASSSGVIWKNLLQNGVGFGVGHRIIERLPGLLKLEQFTGDFGAELRCRVLGVLDHALNLQARTEQPFAFQPELRKLFGRRFLLNDFFILALKVVVDGFDPASEKSRDAQWT